MNGPLTSSSTPEPIINVKEFEPPRFPIEDLGILAAPAQALVEKLQVAEGIAGMSILTAAALIVQAHVDVDVDGRRSPTSLFGLTVAESGERKSQAEELAMKAHRKWERQQYEQRELTLEKNKADAFFWTSRAEKISRHSTSQEEREAALSELGERPSIPLEPSLTVNSPTYEGLLKSYKNGLPYKGIFTDEGGSFFSGYSMRPETTKVTIAGLSSLWDGAKISRTNAAEGESYTLFGRRLAAHIMMQPVIAREVFDSELLNEQGFLPRFLITCPKPKKGTRLYVRQGTTEHPALVNYWLRMESLLSIPVKTTVGALNPRALPLSEEAFLCWEKSFNEIELQLNKFEALYEISAFGSKSANIAARIAAVLAFVENPSATEIQVTHIKCGFSIVKHSLETLLHLRNATSVDRELASAEEIKEWILRRVERYGSNVITKTELQQNMRPKLATATLNKRIKVLVDKGWLKPIPGGAIYRDERVREAWTAWNPSRN